MKITIELNGKRIKQLNRQIAINKQISDIHENRVNELSDQIEKDKKEYNNKIIELSKTEKPLLEILEFVETNNDNTKEQLKEADNQQIN